MRAQVHRGIPEKGSLAMKLIGQLGAGAVDRRGSRYDSRGLPSESLRYAREIQRHASVSSLSPLEA